jgi:hypothetical protein
MDKLKCVFSDILKKVKANQEKKMVEREELWATIHAGQEHRRAEMKPSQHNMKSAMYANQEKV